MERPVFASEPLVSLNDQSEQAGLDRRSTKIARRARSLTVADQRRYQVSTSTCAASLATSAQRDSVPSSSTRSGASSIADTISAGIAVIDECGALAGSKAEGKLARLAERLRNGERLSGHVGIGHTRWATHGRPSDANAHPHLDCTGKHRGHPQRHHRELRGRCARADRAPATLSQRDRHRSARAPDRDALRRRLVRRRCASTLREVRGAYALGVISRDAPERLIFARNGASPLVVGIGDGRDVRRLRHAGDVAVHAQGIILRRGRGGGRGPRRLPAHRLRRQADRARGQQSHVGRDARPRRAGFKHFMLKEIFEQPSVIKETLAGRIDESRRRAARAPSSRSMRACCAR